MGKVINFTGGTLIDSDPDDILRGAIGDYESIVMIGIRRDSDLFDFRSSMSDMAETLLHLEIAKKFGVDITIGDD